MTENVENLILEHLKPIQTTLAEHGRKLDTLTTRVNSLEEHVALLHGDMAGVNKRLDNFERRLERIEHRLNLVEAP